MPLYMDFHKNASGITRDDLEAAHLSDLEIQERWGARYLTYWWNPDAGHIFCLVEAPNKDAAHGVHRESHGLVADTIMEVEPWTVEMMMSMRQEDLPFAQKVPGTDDIDSGLRAIMFTDLAGSTAMIDELGDITAMRHMARHRQILTESLALHGGRQIKQTGDGVLATFPSVSRAVECTVAIQRAFGNHNETSPDGPALEVRIGLSAGEPVEDCDDLFGLSVNLASRVCDAAEAGRIYTVNVVRELCVGKPFNFLDRGEAMLKGFSDPVRLYEISWR